MIKVFISLQAQLITGLQSLTFLPVLLRTVAHVISQRPVISAREAYLLSGEIPLRFDKMVFALGEDWHIVLLDNRGVLSQLDQL